MGLARRALAERVNISNRYLANIENSGSIPSLPLFYAMVEILKLPVQKYFFPVAEALESEQRKRTVMKLRLCPEKYLPIIEHAIDGAIGIAE